MAGYVGNDPYQVQMLGRHLLFGAQLLDELRDRLTADLFNSTWDGPDAHEARSDWASSHAPALGVTAELLRRMSVIAFTNATEQLNASQADGVVAAPGMLHFTPHTDDLLEEFLEFIHQLHFVVDLADIGLTIGEHLVPLMHFLRPAGIAVGVLGLGLDAFALGGYIAEGDAGGTILMGLAVGLGGAAVVVGLVATAPVAIAVGVGLGIVAGAFSLAAHYEPIRDWVGDRWDDAYEFGSGLVDDVTGGIREGFDAAVETTGNVIEGVGDLASDAVDTGKKIFDAIF